MRSANEAPPSAFAPSSASSEVRNLLRLLCSRHAECVRYSYCLATLHHTLHCAPPNCETSCDERDDFPIRERSKLSLIARSPFFPSQASKAGVYFLFRRSTARRWVPKVTPRRVVNEQVRSLPPLRFALFLSDGETRRAPLRLFCVTQIAHSRRISVWLIYSAKAASKGAHWRWKMRETAVKPLILFFIALQFLVFFIPFDMLQCQ